MSLWIKRRDRTGKNLLLIDTHPVLLLIVIGAFIVTLAPHPKFSAWIPGVIVALGVICLAAAKHSVIRRGIWNSWGPSGMTAWNARLYKTAYTLVGLGIALFLMEWLIMR
jgi:hypothetical protein